MSAETKDNCIFCKIIAGDIPGKIVYRDEQYVAFLDVNPKAPLHILVCPIEHTDNFQQTKPDVIAGATKVIQTLATQLGIADNYTLQINNGESSGQEVFHLHIHLLSRDIESVDEALAMTE